MKKGLTLLLTAMMALQMPMQGWSQVPDDFLEEDDFEQQPPGSPGNFPPPPPADPGLAAPPPPEPASSPDPGGGFNSGSSTPNPRFDQIKTRRNRTVPFSQAQPEEITNANFPELIESFDYPNAEIADLVKAISELTGKNFIVEPSVRGKITIIAPTPITVAEAYKAFLSALAINGFTVVPSGKFMKIRPTRAAVRDNMEIYSGAYTPNSDQMVTRIISLKYISADEVGKQLRNLMTTQNGEFQVYTPTNSLIISDFGSNIERVIRIIGQLDVPGFEEQLEVIPIKRAKAKDIADLIDQIINKGQGRRQGQGFTAGIPRFNRPGDSQGGNSPFSLVLPDDRTNAIIVVGNKEGIRKIRELVQKLDFEIRPEDAGGIYVYYVKHGEAELIAKALEGVAKDTKKPGTGGGGVSPDGAPPGFGAPSAAAASSSGSSAGLLGGEVKITFSKETNSLIITASRQDYQVILTLLAKLDIPRDQVFVEALIMEMNAENQTSWGVNYYQFAPETQGVGRVGFSSGNLSDLLNVTKDSGAILGFGSGQTFDLQIPGGPTTKITSFAGFVQFLKGLTAVNILSTPQILAMDNEEATIEVGDNVPIGTSLSTTGAASQQGIQREKATIKLKLTPYINPSSDQVRLKLDQQIKQVSNKPVRAENLAANSVVLTERAVTTNIVIPNQDTAVIGGLIREEEQVSERKVPILGDIPILGWLFKGRSTQRAKINLLVFITPKIVRTSTDQRNLLGNKLNERLEFVKDNMGGRDPYGRTVDKLYRKTSKGKNAVEPTPVE